MKRTLLLLALVGCTLHGSIVSEPPANPDPSKRYFFYLHGAAIEDHGRDAVTRFGRYDYDDILKALSERGFVVVSEARPKGTVLRDYAAKVAAQVRGLIAAGVPPDHITVAGASRGSVMTMHVSTELQNPAVNFVLMGNCNDTVFENHQPRLAGRVLSIYDRTDEFGHTCERFRKAGTNITSYREIEINLGHGHGFLYKAYPDWVNPATAWGKGR